MMLLERTTAPVRVAPRTQPDERAARHALRKQIARLERELSEQFCSSWPRTGAVAASKTWHGGGPTLHSLAELEHIRDGLACRVGEARRALEERAAEEERNRRRLEEMLLDPSAYRGIAVTNESMGEPGCTRWEARPRAGVLGMLMRWWRVVVSSGCPLPS